MNIWRRGPLIKNPYTRTAFRVARVPRDTVRHRTIVQLIGRTRRIVSTDAQMHLVCGQPVNEAELNTAADVLLKPRERIVEELLEHAAERRHFEQAQKLARRAAEAIATPGAGGGQADQAGRLRAWAESLVKRFLDGAQRPDPSFGASETNLIPPFGR